MSWCGMRGEGGKGKEDGRSIYTGAGCEECGRMACDDVEWEGKPGKEKEMVDQYIQERVWGMW